MVTAVLAMLAMLEMVFLGGYFVIRRGRAEEQKSRGQRSSGTLDCSGRMGHNKNSRSNQTHSNEGINNNASGVASGHREELLMKFDLMSEIRSRALASFGGAGGPTAA